MTFIQELVEKIESYPFQSQGGRHHDTYDAAKLVGYQCNCGYELLQAALRGEKP